MSQTTEGVLPGECTLAYDRWQRSPCVMTRDDGFPMTYEDISDRPIQPMSKPVGLVFFDHFDEAHEDEDGRTDE